MSPWPTRLTGGDGSLTQMTTATGDTLNYTYDALKRLNKVTTKNASGTALFSTSYAFRNLSTTDGITQTTTQVQYRNVRIGTNGTILEGKKYSYDDVGNITKISQSTSPYNPLVAYEYDSQNQLTKETYYDGAGSETDNITKTITYTYDTAGNILSETKTVGTTTTTKNYTYSEGNWKDLLTQVGNTTISYDGGNPTNWYNGSKTYTGLTWQQGRQLAGLTVGETSVSYEYDADGIRTKMVAGDVTYEFVTQGGKLMRETATNSSAVYVMDFIYDNAGRPFAVKFSKNGGSSFTTFYYVLNLQGDVVAITKADGTVVAKYTYDAWGNLTSLINANGTEIVNRTTGTAIAFWNPLTYRGYIRDRETGFYYLQSRYYDPANHRFINADSYASTDSTDSISCNMFAYCGNNPIAFIDENGDFFTRGQIHNFVLEEICSHHPSMTWKQTYMLYGIEYRNHTYGYCDLYDIMTHEIWEVKRNGSSYSCSDAFASMQLNNYINNGTFKHQEQKGDYIKGGTKTNIETWTFHKHDPSSGGVYRITYWDAGNGIIKYDYIYIPPKRTVYAMSGAAALIGCLFLVLAAPAVAIA